MSPQVVPAYALRVSSCGKGRGIQEGISRLTELRVWEDQGSYSSKERTELHRVRILEMCRESPSRMQLIPPHSCKETKVAGERTSRKAQRLQRSAWSHAESKTVSGPISQTGKPHDSEDTGQSKHKCLVQSCGILSPKLSTVLVPSKKP